ncbi:MAG TPA: GNAT family protein [Drouetiella sp.]
MSANGVHLSSVSETDLEFMHRSKNDFELAFLMTAQPLPSSREQVLKWLQSTLADRNQVLFGIYNNAELRGVLRFMYIDWISAVAEFGIYLADESRGQGLGRHALTQALEHGFHRLNFNKIWLRVVSSNHSARALYKSVGFVEEGVLKNHFFGNGTLHDLVIMSIFRKDYDLKDSLAKTKAQLE